MALCVPFNPGLQSAPSASKLRGEMSDSPRRHSRRYTAFISYRHADNVQEGRRWAEWLHRALERYVVPLDLIGTLNKRGEPIPDSLYPIFRDEDELPANADLATGVRAALEISDTLVVLCSPRSAASPWVRKEVREFKELGRCDRILTIIIAGEPNADDPGKAREGIMRDEECFCEELRFGQPRQDGTVDWKIRTEPLAADLRPGGTRAEGFVTPEAYREHLTLHSSLSIDRIAAITDEYRKRLENGLLKVIAGLLGVELGRLRNRDAAYRAENAERERAHAEAESAKLRALNEELGRASERNSQLVKQASRNDYATATEHFSMGEWCKGIAYLGRSLDFDATNQFARFTLWQQVVYGIGDRDVLPIAVLRHSEKLRGVEFSPDDTRLVTIGSYAQLWDTSCGKPIGEPMQPDRLPVTKAAFSFDGKSVLTISNRIANLWDAVTGRSAGQPLRHEEAIFMASFSSDGKRVLTASLDRTARLWSAVTGEPLGETLQHEDAVCYAEFSRDGVYVLTGSRDRTARLWCGLTGKPKCDPLVHEGIVDRASFSIDGTRVLTVSRRSFLATFRDQTVRVWDAGSGKPLKMMMHDGPMGFAALSPDGEHVLTIGGSERMRDGEDKRAVTDSTARLWATNSANATCYVLAHDHSVTTCQFSADSTRLLTVSGGTVRIWNANTGGCFGQPIEHANHIKTATFSEDGLRVITTINDNSAKVWDVASGLPMGERLSHEGPLIGATFRCGGTRIVTYSEDNTVRFWDAATGIRLGEPCGRAGSGCRAEFSPDGSRLATFGLGPAYLWDVRTGQQVGEPLRHDGVIDLVLFKPNESEVITVGRNSVKHWNSVTGASLRGAIEFQKNVPIAFSPDGSRLLVQSEKMAIQLWDTKSYNPVGRPLALRTAKASFSRDGRRFVTVSQTARVWDARNGEPVAVPPHEGVVRNAALSPDGVRLIVTAKGLARIFDLENTESVGEPLRGGILSSAFSPDGVLILTGSTDGTANFWSPINGKPVGAALYDVGIVGNATFNQSGTLVATSTLKGVTRIWDVPSFGTLPSGSATSAAFEVISGFVIGDDGHLYSISVPERLARRDAARTAFRASPEWTCLLAWWLTAPSERTASPISTITPRELADRYLEVISPNSLREAMMVNPSHPLIHIAYASLEDDARADFLRSYAVQRLPADSACCAQAAALLMLQEDHPRALRAAEKALALDPKNVEALQVRSKLITR
jgi:WD40 repeat protein